jgi:hypothetical protein
MIEVESEGCGVSVVVAVLGVVVACATGFEGCGCLWGLDAVGMDEKEMRDVRVGDVSGVDGGVGEEVGDVLDSLGVELVESEGAGEEVVSSSEAFFSC